MEAFGISIEKVDDIGVCNMRLTVSSLTNSTVTTVLCCKNDERLFTKEIGKLTLANSNRETVPNLLKNFKSDT